MTIPRFASLALLFAACGDDAANDNNRPDGPVAPGLGNLAEVATAAGDFSALIAAAEAAGLSSALTGADLLTVFAPTDAAFARLGVSISDPAVLGNILKYHIVAGDVRAAQVVGLTSADTLAEEPLLISVTDAGMGIGKATRVTATDVLASNGVIHVIDSVMLPPSIDYPGTVVGAAQAYPAFDTLVSAVVRAQLADDLSMETPAGYTVFAPTNEAFAALGIDLGTLTDEQLTDILLYHVVPTEVRAATVVGLETAPTLNGADISITIVDGKVKLNGDTTVISTDMGAANGVIHVIDKVLLPPTEV